MSRRRIDWTAVVVAMIGAALALLLVASGIKLAEVAIVPTFNEEMQP